MVLEAVVQAGEDKPVWGAGSDSDGGIDVDLGGRWSIRGGTDD